MLVEIAQDFSSILPLNTNSNSTFQKIRETLETNHKGGKDYGLNRAENIEIKKLFISSFPLAKLFEAQGYC